MVLQDIVVQTTVLDNIVTACRKTLPYAVAFTVEGSLKISLVTSEIIVIDVNETGEGKFKKRAKKKETINRTEDGITPPVPKRKRGRPRKVNYQEPVSESENDGDIVDNDTSGILGSESEIPDIKLETVEGVKEEVAESSDILNQQAELGMQALQSLAMQLSGEGDASSQPIEPSSSDLPATDQPPSDLKGEPGADKTEHLYQNSEMIRYEILSPDKIHNPCDDGENGSDSVDDVGSSSEKQLNMSSESISRPPRRRAAILVPELLLQKKPPRKEPYSKGRKNKFVCHICSKDFYKFRQLETHVNIHLNLKPYSCSFCEKSFTSDYYVTLHERSHTKTQEYAKCDYCDKAFLASAKAQMSLHIRTKHTGEKPFKCGQCDKSFVTNTARKYHEQSHSETKLFTCHMCGKGLKTEQSLVQHEKRHGEPNILCSICDKRFFSERELKQHSWTHTGEKPHQCEKCGEKFTQKSSLVHHEKRHTGERPYACRLCNKTYTRKEILREHERLHTGLRPFSCPVCFKSFATKQVLRVHKVSHETEKPHKCKFCSHTFATPGQQRAHERTHTGERPYKCDKCLMAFKQRQQLRRHMYTIYGIGEFRKCYYNNPEKHMPSKDLNLTEEDLN